MIRRVIAAMLVAASVAHAGGVLADDVVAPTAIDLFNQAKDAESRGDYEAACTKFAESAKIDVRVGTLARLAQCEERRGSLLTARAYWAEASELANSLHDPRAAHARQELARVDAQLPKLKVTLAGGIPSGLRPSATDTAAVAAVAEDAPAARAGTTDPIDDAPVHPWSTLKTFAVTAGGASIVAAGLGAYFGLRASSKWSDAKMQCGDGCGPEDPANSTKREARDAATAADIAFGSAGALLAAACGLWFAESRSHPGQGAPALRVVPLAGPVAGIALVARVGP